MAVKDDKKKLHRDSGPHGWHGAEILLEQGQVAQGGQIHQVQLQEGSRLPPRLIEQVGCPHQQQEVPPVQRLEGPKKQARASLTLIKPKTQVTPHLVHLQ